MFGQKEKEKELFTSFCHWMNEWLSDWIEGIKQNSAMSKHFLG